MRYEDSMKGVADQIIKEQQRVSKIINNPEEFHWHDEYATLNFFRFICKNIGNLRNGEIEKMATRLKNIDQKAVENHCLLYTSIAFFLIVRQSDARWCERPKIPHQEEFSPTRF